VGGRDELTHETHATAGTGAHVASLASQHESAIKRTRTATLIEVGERIRYLGLRLCPRAAFDFLPISARSHTSIALSRSATMIRAALRLLRPSRSCSLAKRLWQEQSRKHLHFPCKGNGCAAASRIRQSCQYVKPARRLSTSPNPFGRTPRWWSTWWARGSPTLSRAIASGVTTLEGLAAALNERGILTPRNAYWHASSVSNLLARLG
jgi:hypothetical protein